MDYNKIIDLDMITLADCESMYINTNMTVELNNGYITNLYYEK